MKYKGWSITYDPKPIPVRHWDYDAVHLDWDLDDTRFFHTSSAEEAMREIDEWENDDE